MKTILLRIATSITFEILNTAWFFMRLIFYLYLVWAGMRFASIFH